MVVEIVVAMVTPMVAKMVHLPVVSPIPDPTHILRVTNIQREAPERRENGLDDPFWLKLGIE